jgi:hypothetical protein
MPAITIVVKEADCFGLHSKRALAVLFSVIVTSWRINNHVWQNFKSADASEAYTSRR